MINFLYRSGYRIAYRLLKIFRKIFKPNVRGVFVMIVCKGQLLILKNSYKQNYSVPGGMVGRREAWEDAAVRETFEEVGIKIDRKDLVLISSIERFKHAENHALKIFELQLSDEPEIAIDQREVVWANFIRWSDLSEYRFAEIVKEYITSKSLT